MKREHIFITGRDFKPCHARPLIISSQHYGDLTQDTYILLWDSD